MGLLDQLAGSVLNNALGGGQSGGNNMMLSVVMSLINQSGGLSGLLAKLQSAGLGSQTASWVGTGENQAISADQLQSALGSDVIGQLASQLGMGHQEAAGSLASMLPAIINKMTPNGQVETHHDQPMDLSSLTGMLGGLLGGR